MSGPSLVLYGVLLLSIAVFVVLLRFTGAIACAGRIVAAARDSVATMRSTALTDLEKEARIQRASLAMMGLGLSLLLRAGAALAAALGVAALGAALRLYGADEALAASLDPVFLVVTGAATVAAFVRWR